MTTSANPKCHASMQTFEHKISFFWLFICTTQENIEQQLWYQLTITKKLLS